MFPKKNLIRITVCGVLLANLSLVGCSFISAGGELPEAPSADASMVRLAPRVEDHPTAFVDSSPENTNQFAINDGISPIPERRVERVGSAFNPATSSTDSPPAHSNSSRAKFDIARDISRAKPFDPAAQDNPLNEMRARMNSAPEVKTENRAVSAKKELPAAASSAIPAAAMSAGLPPARITSTADSDDAADAVDAGEEKLDEISAKADRIEGSSKEKVEIAAQDVKAVTSDLPPANGLPAKVADTVVNKPKADTVDLAATAGGIAVVDSAKTTDTASSLAKLNTNVPPPSSQSDCEKADAEASRAKAAVSEADQLFYFRRAVRLCPKEVKYHLAIGRLYSSLGRKEDSEYEFRQVLDLDPNNQEAKQLLTPTTNSTAQH